MRKRLIHLLVSLLLILQAGQITPAAAQTVQATEADLKAAFIYGFIRYVDWPADALNSSMPSFNLCLFGNDPALVESLSTMEGSMVKELRLDVVSIASGDDAGTCHILVVAESQVQNFLQLNGQLLLLPILTVNGSDQFLDAGGVIGMFSENDRIRFDINLASAERTRLTLSSNLLKLARSIRQ